MRQHMSSVQSRIWCIYLKISCSIHYFRVPKVYWEDRLLRLKAMGLNAVQVRTQTANQRHMSLHQSDLQDARKEE